MKAGLLLLPVLLLSGCQSPRPDPEVAQQIAELGARIDALEGEVAELRAGPRVTGPVNAGDVTARAAAQNCAVALARTLELFRQNSVGNRYPEPSQVVLPDACEGQHVGWKKLEGQQYTFAVTSRDGEMLAQQSGP
jgi:outer membrane murein-binding lipoprotein Lpp